MSTTNPSKNQEPEPVRSGVARVSRPAWLRRIAAVLLPGRAARPAMADTLQRLASDLEETEGKLLRWRGYADAYEQDRERGIEQLTKEQRRGDHWKRMAERMEADRDRADKALAQAEQRAVALDAILDRVRSVAGADLDTSPTYVEREQLTEALIPDADVPPLDRRQMLDRAVAYLRSLPVQCTALTGPVWYGKGWKEAISELEEYADRVEFDDGSSTPVTGEQPSA